jgi:hypothetical protein
MAEELIAGTRRQVRLAGIGRLDEFELRAEGRIELVRSEGPGIEGPRDELPEGLEILELGLIGIV